jgi:NAD+ kinase
MASNLDQPDKDTACFVHSLIAGEWVAPSQKLGDIDEATKEFYPDDDPAIDDSSVGQGQDEPVSVIDFKSCQPSKPAPNIVQSRHLTKRQLSDMAWNVRKLSKKLGSVRLKLTVKSVFLVTKARDESLISLTRQVTQWLLSKDRSNQYVVYVEKRLESHPEFAAAQLLEEEPSAEGRLKYWDAKLAHEHPQWFDFVIALGGDGTVLYSSWLFQRIVPPVLSFSLGSLGFLTKFDFNDHERTLDNAFRDGVIVSLRLRFECTIMRRKPPQAPENHSSSKRDLVEELIGEESEDTLTHTPDRVIQILNDVVLDRGPNPSTPEALSLFAKS